MHFLQFTLAQQFSGDNTINTLFQIKKHMLFLLLKKKPREHGPFSFLYKNKSFQNDKNCLCLIKQPSASDLVKHYSCVFLYYYYCWLEEKKCITTNRGLWKGHTSSSSMIPETLPHLQVDPKTES